MDLIGAKLFFCIYDFLCRSFSRNYKLISFNNPRVKSLLQKFCHPDHKTPQPLQYPQQRHNPKSCGKTSSRTAPAQTESPENREISAIPRETKKTPVKPRLSTKRPTSPKILYLKPPLFSILYQKEILEYIKSKESYGSLKSFKNFRVQSNIHLSSFIF